MKEEREPLSGHLDDENFVSSIRCDSKDRPCDK